jgi:hypothetical protein
MKLSRRVMRTDKGEKLQEGSYILTVTKTGRGQLLKLQEEDLKKITIDVLGAEA